MIDTRIDSAEIDRTTTRWVGKVLLATLSLIVLLSLVSLLPGIDRLIPGSPVTFIALVGAIVTLAIVALLVSLAPKVATLVRSTLDGPRPVVDDVAIISQLLVVFVAIIVGHRGLAPAIVPLLDGIAWMYDLMFFVLALPPLVIVAYHMYGSLDPMAELLADRVTESAADDSTFDGTRDDADETGDETTETDETTSTADATDTDETASTADATEATDTTETS